MSKAKLLAAAAALCVFAGPAAAHIMQVAYNLPVPFWMYAYGATAALIASFVVVAWFVRADNARPVERSARTSDGPAARVLGAPALVSVLRVLSVGALALTIVAGFVGTRAADANISMTLFWIVFVLGFTYLTALVGDLYAAIDPWMVVAEWIERIVPGLFRGRFRYPAALAYYPALALYMVFIWLELFGHTNPRSLAVALSAYTVLGLVAAWAFGMQSWLRYIEFFAVFLRLVAKLAPLDTSRTADGRGLVFRVRAPFSALWQERADHFSLLVFVLFMLSSTAFDGIHETVAWVGIFWQRLYPLLATFVAVGDSRQYLILVDVFYEWQWTMLVVSPFAYLAIYYAFMAAAKVVTRAASSVSAIALAFAYALIPIAFVYHVTHYFTLLLSQAPSMASLVSDPFGIGWNLVGLKNVGLEGILLDAGIIWHTQVWLILIGHIVSVYVSHLEALKVFRTSRQATLSQAPILILMVALTTIGLWILSMPIAAGLVTQPGAVAG